MKLSKLEAAKRQLNFAIQAFFENKDIVPIHSLAGAAHIVAHDLVEARNPGGTWANMIATTNNLSIGAALNTLRKTQNDLKHAAKDPNGIIEVDPKDTEFLIISVMLDIGQLNGAEEIHSIEASVYQLWFFAMHEEIFTADEYQPIVSSARQLFPSIKAMQREEQLRCGLKAIEEYKACA